MSTTSVVDDFERASRATYNLADMCTAHDVLRFTYNRADDAPDATVAGMLDGIHRATCRLSRRRVSVALGRHVGDAWVRASGRGISWTIVAVGVPEVAVLVDAVEHVGGLERQRRAAGGRIDLVPGRPASTPSAAGGPAASRRRSSSCGGEFWLQSMNTLPLRSSLRMFGQHPVGVVLLHRLRHGVGERRRLLVGQRRRVHRHVHLQALRARTSWRSTRADARRARRGSTARPRRTRVMPPARRGRGRTRPSSASRCRRSAPSARAARARRGWRPTRSTAASASRQ